MESASPFSSVSAPRARAPFFRAPPRTPPLSLTALFLLSVEGGQRAIFFNRIGGVQQDTILAEGLHFR